MKTTVEELQAFVGIVRSGSITAAADRLGVTVSGLSRALGRLEAKLHTTLLQRTTRRIELTTEGRMFLEHAERILASIDAAEECMATRREQPAGLLRVNASAPFMLHAVVPLVPAFRAAYPAITLELDTDDLNIDLIERRTDVAIRIGTLRDSTLHARPLTTSRLRVLASPAYLEAHGVPRDISDLHSHTLLGFTQPESLNNWPLRGSHGDHWVVSPHVRASSGETLRALALEGGGLACLSAFMSDADIARGDLVQVLAEHTADVRQAVHAVYYRNTQLASRIACFLDFLSAHLGAADTSGGELKP